MYLRNYVTKKGEKRYYLVAREKGKKDHQIQLGSIRRREAEQRRLDALNQLLRGTYQVTTQVRPFFGEFCDKFLTEYAVGSRAPKTVSLYKDSLKHPRTLFQGFRVDEVRREDVERLLADLPVSNRYKNIILSTLRLIFLKAVDWHYLSVSPVAGISWWREERRGSRALKQQELAKVLDLATPWEKSVIKVMVFSGMRPGELSQLKFEDIDWENRILRIVSDRIRKTKSRKSRMVPMSSELEAELKLLWQNLPNMRYVPDENGRPDYLPRREGQKVYVFCHHDGRPVRSFRKSLGTAFRKAGVEGVTPHGLRKTFASMLARNGVHPKVAQKLLGHADVHLTMEIYTEVEDDQVRAAVQNLPTLRDLKKEKFQVVEGCG